MLKVNGNKTIVTLPNQRYLPLIAKLVNFHEGHYQIHRDTAYVVLPTGSPLIAAVEALETPEQEAKFLADAAEEKRLEIERVATLKREAREHWKRLRAMTLNERLEAYEEAIEEGRKEAYEEACSRFQDEYEISYEDMEAIREEAASAWLLNPKEAEEL